MSSKKNTLFECQHCGYTSTKWLGKCPNCGGWDSLVELSSKQIEVLGELSKSSISTGSSEAISIVDVVEDDKTRISTNDCELDLVLGGGCVLGSLVLIGGSPGVGKSTLLLKIASNLAKKEEKVLYVSGEESLAQIKIRANRLDANNPNLFMLAEINIDKISVEAQKNGYKYIVIDSIQTMYNENFSTAPGSVSQVREITFELLRLAKEKDIAIFIIGHITKDGNIAGPRVLEHMVDVVLYFEGDSSKETRFLRSFKNRFGPTNEVGIFEMSKKGLISNQDFVSKFFDNKKKEAGSALTIIMEGSRPIIIEVQALVASSNGAIPKRNTNGFDSNRLTMLLALIDKKLGIHLNSYDVFINIIGGIKIQETSADLAIVAAIISSFKDRALASTTVFIGEISLTGDIRETYNLDIRMKEAEKHKFTKAILPSNYDNTTALKCYNIENAEQLLEWM